MANERGSFVTGDGRVLNVKEISDIFKDCVNLATPSAGKIQCLDNQNFSLTCKFSTVDCDNLESIKTSKSYAMKISSRTSKERCIESVRCISEPQLVGETAVITSNNGRFLARLKGSSSGDKKQFLEIWDRSRLLRNIDISELEAHGPINTDEHFSSMAWYPFGDQDKLIYVCQKKRPKFESFFKQAPSKAADDQTDDKKRNQFNVGGNYEREEDWGECLNGIAHTLVAVLDVGNNLKLTTVEVEGSSLGQVRWLNGLKSVSVAYQEQHRRLGLVYCNSRPSTLVVHDWSQSPPTEVFTLKSDTHSYHTARADHSGQRFLYLANPVYGHHFHAVRMHIHDLNTNQDQELLDRSDDKGGLFVRELADIPFTSDNGHILFTRSDHLHEHLSLFDIRESKLTTIKFPTTGVSLMDFKNDVILATGSEVNATPTMFVAVLNPVNPAELVAWHQIEDSVHLDEIVYRPSTIPVQDGSTFISTILIAPHIELLRKRFSGDAGIVPGLDKQQDLPTVILLHGGPHSAFLVKYMAQLAFYARLGLRTLIINYRGSTGVSEEYCKNLCGKVGDFDVKDCLHAIRHYVSTKQINPKKLSIFGGSHGGFLACHLSCEEEFKFTSAVIRNPVVDLSTLHTTSDIPDWTYTEGLGQECYRADWVPSSAELVRLFECSPMSRHEKAYVPTLMQLGTQDKRVPMFQGERWFELLQARGVKAQCKIYADKHDLNKVETRVDASISSALWILTNL